MELYGIVHASATLRNTLVVPGRRDLSQLGIQELPPVLLASCCGVLPVTAQIAHFRYGHVAAVQQNLTDLHRSSTWSTRTEAVLRLHWNVLKQAALTLSQ